MRVIPEGKIVLWRAHPSWRALTNCWGLPVKHAISEIFILIFYQTNVI